VGAQVALPELASGRAIVVEAFKEIDRSADVIAPGCRAAFRLEPHLSSSVGGRVLAGFHLVETHECLAPSLLGALYADAILMERSIPYDASRPR